MAIFGTGPDNPVFQASQNIANQAAQEKNAAIQSILHQTLQSKTTQVAAQMEAYNNLIQSKDPSMKMMGIKGLFDLAGKTVSPEITSKFEELTQASKDLGVFMKSDAPADVKQKVFDNYISTYGAPEAAKNYQSNIQQDYLTQGQAGLNQMTQTPGLTTPQTNPADEAGRQEALNYAKTDVNRLLNAGGTAGETLAREVTMERIKAQDKTLKGSTDKAPLPTTDKGWTIAYDPDKKVNVAVKTGADGKPIVEPYNPDKHGKALQTATPQSVVFQEQGVIDPNTAKNIAKGVVEGRIAPAQISELAGGFGTIGNMNRKIIANAIVKEAPQFGWKNADILYKYQTNPNVFMGLVNINAVRPRVEALRDKFATLKNLDFLPANKAKNAIAKQFGNDAVVDFEANRTQVVFELQRALTGVGMMSDSRIQQELGNLSESYSPKQMNKAIDNINEILDTRLGALQAGPFSGTSAPNGSNKPKFKILKVE